MDKKFKFNTISRITSDRFDPFETKEDHFIKFGEYNDFPGRLIHLFNNSSIHNTCVNATVEGITGEGLTCDMPELLDKANSDGETWNDIFEKAAVDYKLFGYFCFEVIWSMDRSRIAEVYHIDASWIRAKEKNHRGKIPGYFISDEWDYGYKYRGTINLEDKQYLPVFNPEKREEEPNQLYIYNPYRPGQRYYSLPDYVGALKVIELDAEVDNFHINNIKNGLTPSLAITTFTNANEDERQAIESMLRLQYQGTDNAGQLIYIDVDAPENAPQITPIPQNGADGYYTDINDMVMQKILTAHRITSPMILGIRTEGQLGGRAEVTDAYLLFTNTVIRPMQQDILSCLEYLLYLQNPGTEFALGVEQLKLYTDGSEEVDVVTSDEAEVGDDNILEADIEQAERQADADIKIETIQ